MKLLFIHDDAGAVSQLAAALRRFGFDLELERVSSPAALDAALADRSWSAVITDCEHADFAPLEVLRLVKEKRHDLPVIAVSEAAGEDRALQAFHLGAADFLSGEQLRRLGHIVERELRNVQLRQERRTLFEGLRRAEDRYRRVFAHVPVGVGISTPDGRLISANDRLASIHGFTTGEIIGRRVSELGWDPAMAVENGVEWIENQYFRRDDTVVWTRVTVAPVTDDQGRIEQLAWLAEDVTERKRHEEELQLHAEQQSAIADLSRIALTSAEDAIPRTCNIVHDILEADLSLFLELDPAGRLLLSRAGTPSIPEIALPLQGSHPGLSLERGMPVVVEDDKLVEDGPSSTPPGWAALGMRASIIVPVASSARRFGVLTAHSRRQRRFSEAQIDLMRSLANILADALEREHARRALSASEARNRDIVEGASEIIFTASASGRFTALNAAFEHVTGWSAGDWIGRPIVQLIAEPDRRRSGALFREIVEQRRRVDAELMLDSPNGPILADITCFPKVEQGLTVAVYGFARDITTTRRAELEREQLTRNLQLLLESTVEGIMTIDRQGRCTMVNAAAARILGRPAASLAGASIETLLPPEQARAILSVASSGEVLTRVDRFPRADGSAVPVQYSAAAVVDHDARVGVVVSFSDISERQKLEARLEQADRLSSLGRLAATVAHEFNNVLMGISPFVEVLRRGKNVEAALDHIGRAVKRGKRITEDILRFTQPAEPVRAAIDTSSWLETIVQEATTLLPRGCQLQWSVEPKDLLIHGDANQLHQILTNLMLNARDAMPGGGSISIDVHRETGAHTSSTSIEDPSRFAHFTVRDTGTGIPAGELQQIWEPFFTTKKSGTGLGLPVARQVVERHGGEMFAESKPGIGTAFHIFLPLAAEHDILAAEPVVNGSPASVGHHVLLVEDDETVAAGLMAMLEMAGMRVDLATTGAEAIQKINAIRPDIVLLDVGLPDMEGPVVYQAIAARHPGLPVIFSTGHADRTRLESLLERPNVEYLLKPYETNVLLATIRALLS